MRALYFQLVALTSALAEKAKTVSTWFCFIERSSVLSTLAATEITACLFIAANTAVTLRGDA